LHLSNGGLYFTVRIDGKRTTVKAARTPAGPFDIEASLMSGGQMILMINDEQVARGAAPGLIPTQPIDGFSVGRDTGSAVGAYRAPFPLEGQVHSSEVKAGPAAP
jgi:hypothetical protein